MYPLPFWILPTITQLLPTVILKVLSWFQRCVRPYKDPFTCFPQPAYLTLLHFFGAAVSFLCVCFYAALLTVLTAKCVLTGYETFLYPLRFTSTVIQSILTICCILLKNNRGLKQLSDCSIWSYKAFPCFVTLQSILWFYVINQHKATHYCEAERIWHDFSFLFTNTFKIKTLFKTLFTNTF